MRSNRIGEHSGGSANAAPLASVADSIRPGINQHSIQALPKLLSKLFAVFAVALLLASCDSTSEEPSGAAHPGGLTFAVPGPIGALRMVNQEQLRVEAIIGNNSIRVSRRTGEGGRQTWQSDPFALPGTGSFPLEIRWYDRSRSRELILAEFGPLMLSNSSDRNIAIRESEYNYNFDQDGDGSSNIAEIRNETDPFVAGSPGTEDDPPIVDEPSMVNFNVLVSAPSEIQAAPFVDASQLQADVVFIVGSSVSFSQALTRNGEMWAGEFSARASDERFNIFWYEIINDQRVELGTSLLQSDSNALTELSVRDENLRFNNTQSDNDNDGRNNLRERATGTNPLSSDPPSPYNDNQTACGNPGFVIEATGDSTLQQLPFSAPARVFSGLSERVSLVNVQGTSFVQGSFGISGTGTMDIAHVAGPPNDSVLEIWERQLDGTLRLIERADDPSAVSRRAALSVALSPGGYCFLMVAFRTSPEGTFTGPLEVFGESSDGVDTIEMMFDFQ